MMKLLNLLILLFISTSCAMFEHRDYEYEMSEFNFIEPMFQANRDFMTVSGDSGRSYRTNSEISARTPATERQNALRSYDKSLNRELQNLEMKISEPEYDQFSRYRSEIGGVSEQIYYLRLSPEAKTAYLHSRGIIKSSSRYEPNYANNQNNLAFVAMSSDVTLGMDKNAVLQSWGQPERREVSGSINEGNERWSFRRNGKIKYIYFEGGRVQGWTEQ